MLIQVSSFCETGLVRKVNQDSILTYQNLSQDFSLFLVADGMGGYQDGEKASAAIVSHVRQWLELAEAEQRLTTPTLVLTELGETLEKANSFIRENLAKGRICGSTCVMLVLMEGMYAFFSVGDSRIYLLRGRTCQQLTQDDVWENQQSVRSSLTPRQLRDDPNYGRLTHAVGTKDKLSYSMQTDSLQAGDLFALCSDGVYKMCSPRFFQGALRHAKRRRLEETSQEIRQEVLRCGARDNLSLILVRCLE